ncbi:MAG: ATP-binding protein [Planctomycetota bacterium]|nr:ATP-binding protein [Planctomycetota bacterium]
MTAVNLGTGKTHVATALGIEACGRGKKVRFWQVTELITQLIGTREERVLERMKQHLAKLNLLILDELGYAPAGKLGAERLLDDISPARHGRWPDAAKTGHDPPRERSG